MKAKLIAFSLLAPAVLHGEDLYFDVKNPLDIARTAVTVELTAGELADVEPDDLRRVIVTDAEGAKVLSQALDTDGDPLRKADLVIFQTDLAPGQTKKFKISAGDRKPYQFSDFKAYARFNRERFDDFAWENDRIAHRTYGHALETWEGEPLSSSTIDVWSKRTPRMVINDWYLGDDYHVDHGEGADFYSAGLSRGCGGGGIWAGGRLWTSRNFVSSNVLANGPIRVLFELTYPPFEVDGVSVSEVKRISLDAGSQLNHITSTYKQFMKPGESRELTAAIGLKKVEGEQVTVDKENGMLFKWEQVASSAGHQGLAVVFPMGAFDGAQEDGLNHLALTPVPKDGIVESWAGFAWDKAEHIPDAAAWKKYLEDFCAAVLTPIQVTRTEP